MLGVLTDLFEKIIKLVFLLSRKIYTLKSLHASQLFIHILEASPDFSKIKSLLPARSTEGVPGASGAVGKKLGGRGTNDQSSQVG